MIVLNGILKESKEYYDKLEKELKNRLRQLPKGNIKKRNIRGKIYYYLQYRKKDKIKQMYLGKSYPQKKADKLIKIKKERNNLKNELIKVKEALRLLNKTGNK